MEVGPHWPLRYVDELWYHELGSLETGEYSRIVVRLRPPNEVHPVRVSFHPEIYSGVPRKPRFSSGI
jgi:hypothetical protein